jgi:hypothetical protein
VPSDEHHRSSTLERAIAFARQNQQVAIWDRCKRPYAIGVYDSRTKRVLPLTDEQAGIILNRDPSIAREWRKWNGMTQNQGSLIVVDRQHVRAALKAANEEPASDDDVMGLA